MITPIYTPNLNNISHLNLSDIKKLEQILIKVNNDKLVLIYSLSYKYNKWIPIYH